MGHYRLAKFLIGEEQPVPIERTGDAGLIQRGSRSAGR